MTLATIAYTLVALITWIAATAYTIHYWNCAGELDYCTLAAALSLMLAAFWPLVLPIAAVGTAASYATRRTT